MRMMHALRFLESVLAAAKSAKNAINKSKMQKMGIDRIMAETNNVEHCGPCDGSHL